MNIFYSKLRSQNFKFPLNLSLKVSFPSVLLAVTLLSNIAWADDKERNENNAQGRHGKQHIRAIKASDYFPVDTKKAALGQALFFDKELSGNRNISCSTCHSPLSGTSDGLSINLGEGARGFGMSRNPGTYPPAPTDPLERGQRNAPSLFDRGAKEFTTLMHDGRIELDSSPDGFLTPAGDELPPGFNNLLEVISIFAFTEIQEMLGQPNENDVAAAAAVQGSLFTPVWNKLVERVKAQPNYHPLIFAAYPELNGNIDGFSIVHVGRAIANFQSSAFRTSLNTPVDRFLKGDDGAISKEAARGYKLFTGKAQCSSCHNGPFLTDQKFHAIGVPQIGPGFGGVGNDGREDFGREGVTNDINDRYKFRTPPLRNVALTGPWGHDGAFNMLEDVVRHHLDAKKSLHNYDPSQCVLPSRLDLDDLDYIAVNNPATIYEIERRIEIPKIRLNEKEFDDLMAFMFALTDPEHLDLRHTVPKSVPSGLTLAD
ncbi:MAG: cytochrome c peroxidase [Cellvibrio sp.]|uniref:cytochrome-c peroxidase n=1 Tax=Cellvibrio sp. TaxID=1965322 RepID=UPI0027211547|nr:cytochrome c peroxidase [Cellvibrio sp.]